VCVCVSECVGERVIQWHPLKGILKLYV